jgi:hypothetical protein
VRREIRGYAETRVFVVYERTFGATIERGVHARKHEARLLCRALEEEPHRKGTC